MNAEHGLDEGSHLFYPVLCSPASIRKPPGAMKRPSAAPSLPSAPYSASRVRFKWLDVVRDVALRNPNAKEECSEEGARMMEHADTKEAFLEGIAKLRKRYSLARGHNLNPSAAGAASALNRRRAKYDEEVQRVRRRMSLEQQVDDESICVAALQKPRWTFAQYADERDRCSDPRHKSTCFLMRNAFWENKGRMSDPTTVELSEAVRELKGTAHRKRLVAVRLIILTRFLSSPGGPN